MKILVCDFLVVEAHRTVNKNLIRALAAVGKVDVISINDYYIKEINEFNEIGVNIIKCEAPEAKKGKISSRLYSISLMKEQARIAKVGSYDLIISMAFETLGFALGAHYFRGTPICLFHHKNTDELVSKLKRGIFNTYKNQVFHLVFEQFFADYLVDTIGINKKRVIVIPHPVGVVELYKSEPKYDCVGISNSNSQELVEEIIAANDRFEKAGKFVLLRSKKSSADLSNVKVIKGFLPLEEYNKYISEAKAIYVPLPNSFIYRLSASIYDAVAQHKYVYTTSPYYAEEYNKRYPGICAYVSSVDELLDEMVKNKTVNEEMIDKFLIEHSSEFIAKCMASAFETVAS